MKICVYAISKNEEAFVERFCASAKDADMILIADTGSTDNTVSVAKQCGAEVYTIGISPWRFDKARDAALALIPKDYDICISLDLDEVLEEGWRGEVERLWTSETTRMRYKFDWGEGIVFYSDKIHSRHGYRWHHPCHECLRYDPRFTESWVSTDKLLVTHLPDKTKSRGQYLDLLKLSVLEDPYCPRNAFYYARELYFYRHWHEAIEALHTYLNNPQATWEYDRCYAYRVLSHCYEAIGDKENSILAATQASVEVPTSRDPWVNLAEKYSNFGLWEEAYQAAVKALSITTREVVYTSDPNSWGYKPYDLKALASYYTGRFSEALEAGLQAIQLDPNNKRLLENLYFYKAAQK